MNMLARAGRRLSGSIIALLSLVVTGTPVGASVDVTAQKAIIALDPRTAPAASLLGGNEAATCNQSGALVGCPVSQVGGIYTSLTTFVAQIRRSFASNPRTLGTYSALTVAISSSTTVPSGSDAAVKVPATTTALANWAPYVRTIGAPNVLYGGSLYPAPAISDPTLFSNGQRAGTRNNVTRFAFNTTSYKAYFGIAANTLSSASALRVLIDGQYVSTTPITAPASLTVANYYQIDLTNGGAVSNASARSVVPRRIEIECSGTCGLTQIWVPATETISAPPIPVAQVLLGGDSWVQGPATGMYSSPAPIQGDGMAAILGDRLGAETVNTGEGGTGWCMANGNAPALKDHIYDLLGRNPDGTTRINYHPNAIILSSLQNDITGGYTPAQIVACMETVRSQLRAFYGPRVPIIITGGFTPKGLINAGNQTALVAAETAIATQIATDQVAGDKYLAFIPTSTVSPFWVNGTGTGDGNWDWAGGVSGTVGDFHPSYLGNQYLGQRLAQSVQAALEAMLPSPISTIMPRDVPSPPANDNNAAEALAA